MNTTDEQIKELKQLLWVLDSIHNVSIPQTQKNINYIADEIAKLFSIPDVDSRRELLIDFLDKLENTKNTTVPYLRNSVIVDMYQKGNL